MTFEEIKAEYMESYAAVTNASKEEIERLDKEGYFDDLGAGYDDDDVDPWNHEEDFLDDEFCETDRWIEFFNDTHDVPYGTKVFY